MPENSGTVEAEILDLMLRAGSAWVLWLLLALSVVAVAVILERVWFLFLERRPSERLAEAFAALRRSGPEEALAALEGTRSMQVTVARAGLRHLDEGPAALEEHVTAAIDNERLRYERGLVFLGTLGNNAPFIGLFGTVLGIIRAFHDLSVNITAGSQAVMAGIAEALVATGAGLLVALPAVAAYNAFTRAVETSAVSAGAVGHEILAFAKADKALEEGATPGEAA